MAVVLKPRRFTVDEFHRMAEAGILTEDDRVELIDGKIVEMTPIGFRHMRCVIFLTEFFVRCLAERALVSSQNPVRLGRRVELQPDVALLRAPLAAYAEIPSAGDVLLVIEVSEASLARDRRKLSRYARAGIAEAWLVDLEAGVVEMHRTPTPEGYQEVARIGRGRRVSPAAFPDAVLAVDEIIG